MNKVLAFWVASFVIQVTVPAMAEPLASSVNRPRPVPLYGFYDNYIDRSKETLNGHPINAKYVNSRQSESFTTTCTASGCVAQMLNLRPPPQYFSYYWVNGRWESHRQDVLYCKDGRKLTSTVFDYFTPNADGSFSGERTLKVEKPGCVGESEPGTYWVPIKLVPTETAHPPIIEEPVSKN